MRRAAGAALLAVAAFLALHARASEDAALQEFLARFRPAVRAGDARGVADLTQLPFLFEGEPHDRDDFVRVVFPQLFAPPVRVCLAEAEPVPEGGRWMAACGSYLLYFGRVGDEVRLLEFAADPEAEAP